MNHIAERLRNRNTPYGTIALLDEAANEIERLTAERNRWRTEYLTASADAMKFVAERDELRAKVSQLISELTVLL